jgi:hypothetical protein
MRQLTKKERQYLVILGGAGFVFLNVLGFDFYAKNQQRMNQELRQHRQLRLASQVFLNEEPLWKERKSWLLQHQPKYATPGDAQSALKDKILKTAQNNQVSITNPQFLMSSTSEKGSLPFDEATMSNFKVTSSLEHLVRWLTELQQPEEFIAITSLSLHSTPDPNIVECELKTSLWYNFFKQP